MWRSLAKFVIKNRFGLLAFLLISTAAMGYFAYKVKLSYEFSKAIPTDNPKFVDYTAFKNKFGDDGNLLVVGVTTKDLFTLSKFKLYQQLQQNLKKVAGVEDILSVPGAFNLKKNIKTEKLNAVKIFPDTIYSQQELDSAAAMFYSLPFYNERLYNKNTGSYLMAVRVNKNIFSSEKRTTVLNKIVEQLNKFEQESKIEVHASGLPLIRTILADRIKKEMKLFLLASLGLSVLILLLFFRSFSTTFLSLTVVIIGVIWTLGITYLCGYQITLLTALIPSLVVVIGIPNCIYFINKYHTSYLKDGENSDPKERKNNALIAMVSKMGIVTLFCNITAAIGFVVFAFTKSEVLQEFGVVAGISIMVIFFVSFILLPSVLSLLQPPGKNQLKYLNNKLIESTLNTLKNGCLFIKSRCLPLLCLWSYFRLWAYFV